MPLDSQLWSLRLQRARWQSGITVKQLAALASVSVASIRMAECGSLDVGLLALVRIAEALHVDICELLRDLPAVTKLSDLHIVHHRRRLRIAFLP
ncbi:MAG TPA: helix-turn-helix transcriptional regulator [Trichormus sp.]|jgi:transcriptional regulator with XRE-family HTH domain